MVFEDDRIRIETIESLGEISPKDFWYNQCDDEWVYILCGCGVLEFSDGTQKILNSGESYLIEKNNKHRVAQVSDDCKWLCVFMKER